MGETIRSTRGEGRAIGLRMLALACASAAFITLVAVFDRGASGAPTSADPASIPDVRRYCTNIVAAATDARFAWQTSKLNELETRMKKRIKELDAKEAELRDWIGRREALERKASEKLVGIYSKMRPETAATQLSALDDDMAAAVIGQLSPRQASAIFNEIVPERAAKLAGMIAGNKPADDKKL